MQQSLRRPVAAGELSPGAVDADRLRARVGEAENCRTAFYALTAERKIVHPAVAAIVKEAAS